MPPRYKDTISRILQPCYISNLYANKDFVAHAAKNTPSPLPTLLDAIEQAYCVLHVTFGQISFSRCHTRISFCSQKKLQSPTLATNSGFPAP